MIDQSLTSQEAADLLHRAVEAVKANDRKLARQYSQSALQLNPYLELAWLILASVSSPPAARAYLEKALTLLPNSERLKKAYYQLENNLNIETTENTNYRGQKFGEIQPNNSTHSVIIPEQTKFITVHENNSDNPSPKRSKFLIQMIVFFFVLLILFFSVKAVKPTLVLAFQSESSIINRPADAYDKPSRTPTAIPTNTAAPTATPTLTSTPTAEPTATITPTFEPTLTQPEVAEPTSQVVTNGDRWIDIDLSDQMVYAYEDDILVNSFLVSTGTIYTPTVTGQFYVYVKYEAADMSGPGYYLPAVPYVMYFYQDYGIHAATWHNNFGTPMSHGCINMRLEDAEWIYNWSSIGTLVNIHE